MVRDKTICWLFDGRRNKAGYGLVPIRNARGKRSYTTASRDVLEARIGRRLERHEYACHHCDNPPCINPDHLYVGNAKSNARDMLVRKRRTKKPRPHTRFRKLTDEQVRAIRADDRMAHIVAHEMGVAEGTVYNIRAGRRKALVPA